MFQRVLNENKCDSKVTRVSLGNSCNAFFSSSNGIQVSQTPFLTSNESFINTFFLKVEKKRAHIFTETLVFYKYVTKSKINISTEIHGGKKVSRKQVDMLQVWRHFHARVSQTEAIS